MSRRPQARSSFYERRGKRALDVLVAGTAMVILLPVQGVVAVLVRRNLGSPVIFRQTRPGLRGLPFEILKFRTMADGVDAEGKPLPDEERLSRFGQLLRSTSLDELPELWNAVRGDMSLVGPRPLLTKYMPLYTPEQARRHDVRPGVTGWAQINGRNNADWHEKLTMDLWYVDNVSLLLDLKILLKTAIAVLTRRGISAEGHVTTPEFTGLDSERAS